MRQVGEVVCPKTKVNLNQLGRLGLESFPGRIGLKGQTFLKNTFRLVHKSFRSVPTTVEKPFDTIVVVWTSASKLEHGHEAPGTKARMFSALKEVIST